MKHLAIFKGSAAEDILTGKKTIDSRFSKAKIAPFGQITSGDLVYIKPSGKEIIGQFRVKKVIFYDGLEDLDIGQSKKDSKYGTLIFIGECDPFLTSPIRIKKKDQRGWVVLG